MEKIIDINLENIDDEHISCAISDKKCAEGYRLKKEWLKEQFRLGYVFKRIDARGKVFIEYGPAENIYAPIDANDYLLINCFWVSGKYKGKGYGKQLLKLAIEDCKKQGKAGLVTVVGQKKNHFMSDGKWLLGQGFVECDTTSTGFSLIVLDIVGGKEKPKFKEVAVKGRTDYKEDIVVYYSNRCPFTKYHVENSMVETAKKRDLSYRIVELKDSEDIKNCPSPATIFSIFYKGDFISTDVSICMDSKFDKILGKKL